MSLSLRETARKARYALPGHVGRIAGAPDAAAAARGCAKLHRRGLRACVGYFQADDAPARAILAANLDIAGQLAGLAGDSYLSVKAPPLHFDAAHLRKIARAAAEARLAVLFDAHAPQHARDTLEAAERLLPDFPGTGCALPARWRRSAADAARLRESSARIRIVKGEWADPEALEIDVEGQFFALAAQLAGRPAPVAVATHDPILAESALRLLLDAGTPCELEQLRGLPSRRCRAVAHRLGVPVRFYLPFGPGWWPYAIDKALARPYLPLWLAKDLLGLK